MNREVMEELRNPLQVEFDYEELEQWIEESQPKKPYEAILEERFDGKMKDHVLDLKQSQYLMDTIIETDNRRRGRDHEPETFFDTVVTTMDILNRDRRQYRNTQELVEYLHQIESGDWEQFDEPDFQWGYDLTGRDRYNPAREDAMVPFSVEGSMNGEEFSGKIMWDMDGYHPLLTHDMEYWEPEFQP